MKQILMSLVLLAVSGCMNPVWAMRADKRCTDPEASAKLQMQIPEALELLRQAGSAQAVLEYQRANQIKIEVATEAEAKVLDMGFAMGLMTLVHHQTITVNPQMACWSKPVLAGLLAQNILYTQFVAKNETSTFENELKGFDLFMRVFQDLKTPPQDMADFKEMFEAWKQGPEAFANYYFQVRNGPWPEL